jgi:PucR family transcriptional regulator, purine catabolism regulatory protein
MITVQDVIHLALPQGTQVVAGESGLDREVTWVTRLRPSPPAFGHLSGGELVLLPTKVLELLDERLTLEEAVRQLARFGVAAIAHPGRVTAGARAAANEAGVPFLHLPADAELGLLERDASRLITERRREVQRRGQEVGRRLMELAIAGESLPVMVQSLADLSQRPVVLESRDGRLLAYHAPSPSDPSREEIAALLEQSRGELGSWLRSTAASSSAEPPTTIVPLDDLRERVVAPIIGREGLLGSLSLIKPDRGENPEETLFTSRGAAACAVVLAREQAAATARRELELNVLDEVLDGALRSEVSLLQQAKRLGHDLQAPHVAIVARLDQSGPTRNRDGRWSLIDEVMARRGSRVLWRLRHNNAEIVWPVVDATEAKSVAKSLFDDLSRRIQGKNLTGLAVSVGVGRIQSGLTGIRQSHQEAKQAISMGRRLDGPGHLTPFESLGVYRLIFAAENLPELRSFHDETLDSLIAYDQQHGGELIRTLEAFFDARCSPKEAATLLNVHRNTVLYRLDRVREITGLDLDNANVRLRLHLALCTHLALFEDGA